MTTTMELDFSLCRLPPFAHQKEDTEALVNHPFFFIASEPRTGKSKICIDALQFLYLQSTINRVIIVAPSPVRSVWYDQDLGELKKHLWIKADIHEFHIKHRMWSSDGIGEEPLLIICTNFEFLRAKSKVDQLLPFCTSKTLLIGDESSFLKNWESQQTKAFFTMRKLCGRVVELNGTPITHSPLDLFSQANILHHSILDCPYIGYFKARYSIQEPILGASGKPLTKVVGKGKFTKEIVLQHITGWTNLEDVQERLAPYTVRRLQKDCLDLPPKLDPVILTATLDESWPFYKSMRDDFVVWLKSDVATAATAAIKSIRLAQITSGFVGGVEDAAIEDPNDIELDWCDIEAKINNAQSTSNKSGQSQASDPGTEIFDDFPFPVSEMGATDRAIKRSRHINQAIEGEVTTEAKPRTIIQAVGKEKIDLLLWFLGQRLEIDPCLHVVVWCRFRFELERIYAAVAEKFPQFTMGMIYGGQKKQERLDALKLLHPELSPKGPVFMVGTEGTGSFGLNFTAAHTCITMSSGYSPGRSMQMLDRVYGPGQLFPIAYYSVIAVGPKGQRTIDHQIEVARRNGEDLANWTTAHWVKALTDE